MATDTAPVAPAARRDPRQVANTLKKIVNYNDAGISTGLSFDNSLPEGANILNVQVEIITAFNAATTNVLTVGSNSSTYNDIVAAGDVNEAAIGVTDVSRARGQALCATVGKDIKAMYTQSGTAATAGKAWVTITYEAGGPTS